MPSFAIEVPGEANPLSKETLLHTLVSASSTDQQQVQTGTKQLQNWEKTPQYFASLQSIYIDLALPLQVRYLAIIQLKNAVDKYWRKAAKNALQPQEKEFIRNRSLGAVLQEPDSRLALQSAVFVSRILRAEYPREWPDGLPSIIRGLSSIWNEAPTSPRLSRVLVVLLYSIKELSTARLRGSQKNLQDAAPEIIRVLFSVYKGSLEKWVSFLQNGGNDEGRAMDSMDTSLLCLRILRRLVIAGFEHPNRTPELREIWQIINAHFGQLLSMVSLEPNQPSKLSAGPNMIVEKHLQQIAKLHLNMAKDRAPAFVLLPASSELVMSYWQLVHRFSQSYGVHKERERGLQADGNLSTDEVPLLEKLSLRGLLILRACSKMIFNPAQTFKYLSESDKEEKKASREMLRSQLLTPEFALEVMERLVRGLFVYTVRDLERWEEEPEEWEEAQEAQGEDWEFTIRTCAEKLFLDLVINYKDHLVPSLLNIIMSAGAQESADVFGKDSIYAAIGLAAPVLYDILDFTGFLDSNLVKEVQAKERNYNILRRRIAIVLGQWLPVKEGLDRPLVYQIFQHLLDEGDPLNDEVVRITAGRQLHSVIDPFEFDPEGFAPFAPSLIERLLDLIKEVEQPDTKLALLQTLNSVVVKMEQRISPLADNILAHLAPMWDAAGDEFLLKQAILGMLTALVTAMGTDSQRYHVQMVSIIQSAVEPDSESKAYLDEDALDLWSAILEQVAQPIPAPVVGLLQHIVQFLESASDILQRALAIVESYIYLMPAEIVSNAAILLGPFTASVKGGKREAVGAIIDLVELLIRSSERSGGSLSVEALTKHLLSSGFLCTMLEGIRDAYEAHQTTGPNMKYPSIDLIVEIDFLTVLARIAVVNPYLLTSAFESAATTLATTPAATAAKFIPSTSIDWLLNEWLAQVDNMSHPTKKKLSCLALTSLLSTGEPWILDKLQLLMSIWTSVLTELEEDLPPTDGSMKSTSQRKDCLLYTPDTLASSNEKPRSAMEQAQQELMLADPAHRYDTRTFIRERITEVVNKTCNGNGEAFRAQWLVNIDADVLRAFGELGVI